VHNDKVDETGNIVVEVGHAGTGAKNMQSRGVWLNRLWPSDIYTNAHTHTHTHSHTQRKQFK
jgi:hypothetical protein